MVGGVLAEIARLAPIEVSPGGKRMRTTAAGGKLALALAVSMGMLGALAAYLNGAVTIVIGDPLKAALLSFSTGTLVLLVINLGFKKFRGGIGRVFSAYSKRLLPWWFVLEGAVAAFGVSAQSQSVAIAGVAVFTITAVAGQTISSILVDKIGFGPSGVIPVTPLRLIAGFVILLAVSISMSDKIGGIEDFWTIVFPLSLTFAAGLTMGFQQAMNGRTAHVAGSPMVSALQNFIMGTMVLLVVVGIRHASSPAVVNLPTEWWLYLSGPVAVVFVFLIGYLVKTLGVLVLAICAIAGQVTGSVVLDLAVPSTSGVLSATTVAGAALTVASVILVTIAQRRPVARAAD